MKNKRIFVAILAMAMLFSSLAIPASAANYAIETIRADMGGGASVSTQSARKNVTRRSMYYNAKAATSDGWSTAGNEWVYFRGRNSGGDKKVTKIAYRNYNGALREGYLTYETGYGKYGYNYKIAIEYDNSNPFDFVKLRVGWAP